jgi:hypothetical protein
MFIFFLRMSIFILFLFFFLKKKKKIMQAPEIGLLAPDLVVYLDIQPEVSCICHYADCYKLISKESKHQRLQPYYQYVFL